MSNKAAVLFRVVAIAEAFSWMGLLVGMFLKYVVELGEGVSRYWALCTAHCSSSTPVTTLAVARPLGWRFGTVLAALLAAVPPLFTWLFERWALRRGKLDGPSGCATAAPLCSCAVTTATRSPARDPLQRAASQSMKSPAALRTFVSSSVSCSVCRWVSPTRPKLMSVMALVASSRRRMPSSVISTSVVRRSVG